MAELHSLGQEETRQKHSLCSKAETYETVCGGVDVLLHSTTRSSNLAKHSIILNNLGLILSWICTSGGKPTQYTGQRQKYFF